MIPRDRYIDCYDLLQLDPENIIKEFKETFPDIGIECFRVTRPILKDLFSLMDDSDVLLVPGDSPFKFIKTLEINHAYEDGFLFDGVFKRFTILTFPLSGKGEFDHDELDSYLLKIFEKNGISLDSSFKMFDLTVDGGTWKTLRNSLVRLKMLPIPPLDLDTPLFYGPTVYIDDPLLPLIMLSPNWYQLRESPQFRERPFNFRYEGMSRDEIESLQKLENEHLYPCYSFNDDIIMVAESVNCRCVPKYDLNRLHPLPEGSLYRCNLAIAVMALMER